jgi:hypothetical protein
VVGEVAGDRVVCGGVVDELSEREHVMLVCRGVLIRR